MPQPPPPPPPPPPVTPGSPHRKGLSPSRLLAAQSETVVSTGTPTRTRAGVSRVAVLHANTAAAEQAAEAVKALGADGIRLLGGMLSGHQVGSILSGFLSSAGTAKTVVAALTSSERAQMVVAALSDPAAVRSALHVLVQLDSNPSVRPPAALPAMVQSAIPQLSETELLDVLDVMGHRLMDEVR